MATVISDLSGGSDVDSDGEFNGTEMEGLSEREGISSALAKDAAAMARALGASPHQQSTSPQRQTGSGTRGNVINLSDLPDLGSLPDSKKGKSQKKGKHVHHND